MWFVVEKDIAPTLYGVDQQCHVGKSHYERLLVLLPTCPGQSGLFVQHSRAACSLP